MPAMDAMDTIKQIRAACPTAAAVVLTEAKAKAAVVACLRAGVNGYLLKNTPVRDLANAIRLIHAGASVFNFGATGGILCDLRSIENSSLPAHTKLYNRELKYSS